MSSPRILGVLNGSDLPTEKLLQWASSADVIYAADGGARRLVDGGFRPIIVGDLDSLDTTNLPEGLRIVHDSSQETTDCDKLLATAAHDGVSAITIVGVEGDRLDHVLATLGSLVGRRKRIRLGLRRGIGMVIPCGETIQLPAVPGQTISLIPLTLCWGVSLTGVEWELEDAELRPGLHVSISNVAVKDPCLLMAGGTSLVVIEHSPEEMPIWQP